MTEKKVNMTFKIEPSLKKRAEELAEAKGMTLGAFIRDLIATADEKENSDTIEELRQRIERLEKEVFGR